MFNLKPVPSTDFLTDLHRGNYFPFLRWTRLIPESQDDYARKIKARKYFVFT